MRFQFAALACGAIAGLCRRAYPKVMAAPAAAPAAPAAKAKDEEPDEAPFDTTKFQHFGNTKDTIFSRRFKPFTLGEVINLGPDVAIFRFLLPNEDDVFALPPCSTLQCLVKQGSQMVEQIQRFYTPITPNGAKGYFDIIVRKYPGGRMTEHLFSMEAGERMQFRTISTKLKYIPNKWKEVGLIGGGTGITSLLQVIRAVVENPSDKTKCTLLFANRTERKILLKGLLDQLVKDSNGRFFAHYTVDSVTEKWDGMVGKIDAAMIQKTMPKPSKDNIICVCGPDKMMQSLCGIPSAVLKAMSGGYAYQPMHSGLGNLGDLAGALGDLGYGNDEVYRF